MASKLNQPWIPPDRVATLVQLEPALLIAVLALGSWLVYRFALRSLNPDRHRSLRAQFTSLSLHLAIFTGAFSSYAAWLGQTDPLTDPTPRLLTYLGLITLIWGALVFVKTARILLSEYLFYKHMRVGVPLLLINLFTLLFSLIVSGWLTSEIFAIKVGSILATSAALSLVIGLAAQDTLGNLFAGIALQIDKPYNIGDWIEVHNGPQKWGGKVMEISWRATVLLGWSEEFLTIPNRVVAMSQVSNFSHGTLPISRSVIFRLPHWAPAEDVRNALLRAAKRIKGITSDPAPSVLTTETGESWIPYKLVYSLNDFGTQYTIADQMVQAGMDELRASGLELATPQIQVNQKA